MHAQHPDCISVDDVMTWWCAVDVEGLNRTFLTVSALVAHVYNFNSDSMFVWMPLQVDTKAGM